MQKQKKQVKTKSNTQGGQAKKAKKGSPMVRAPVSQSRKQVTKSAHITHTGSSCRVKHREFVRNVSGSIYFKVDGVFPVQPGLSLSFPWLAGIANNYDQYRVHSLKMIFLSRCSSATAGSVMVAPDYDSSDSAPISEAVMTAFAGTTEDAPWKEQTCVLNPTSLMGGMTRKFIRSQDLLPNQDLKTYDCGNVFIGVVDATTDAVPWGKLWVEYDIEFFVPALHSTGNMVGGGFFSGGAQTLANPFGTTPIKPANTYGLALDAASNLTVGLGGDYMLTQLLNGTGLNNMTFPTISNGTGQINNVFTANAAGTIGQMRSLITSLTPGSIIDLGTLSGTTVGLSSLDMIRAISGSLA